MVQQPEHIHIYIKAGVSCLKCMQLQLYAVVMQVCAVLVAVVAAWNHNLQLYLHLRLA